MNGPLQGRPPRVAPFAPPFGIAVRMVCGCGLLRGLRMCETRICEVRARQHKITPATRGFTALLSCEGPAAVSAEPAFACDGRTGRDPESPYSRTGTLSIVTSGPAAGAA